MKSYSSLCLCVSVVIIGFIQTGVQADDAKTAAQKVSYSSGKEKVNASLFLPPGNGPFPAVIVVHGDFGPTDWVKQQGKRLAGKGFTCLVIDLYRGEMPKDVEEAHILERGLPEDRVQSDLRAAVSFLAGRTEVQKEKIGILGFDMGGGHALDAALRDARLKAVVNCYGRLTTEAKRLGSLQAPVLGLFAGKDEGISVQTIDTFRAAMKKAGKRAEVHIYPKCDSSFLDPTSPYTAKPLPKDDIADAWMRIEKFLAAELKAR